MSDRHTAKDRKRLAYSVRDFADETTLSRSLLYEAIRRGELQTVKIRNRRLTLVQDGEAWLRAFRGGDR
jgi:predicted DNA-binding protein YlxM (UPF0122 family)